MNDVFARIGLAIQHLAQQSTVHGPAREEVDRLAKELQELQSGLNEIVNTRIAAAVEAIEGRLNARIDQDLNGLAEALESPVTFVDERPEGGATTASEENDSPVTFVGDDTMTTGGDDTLQGGQGDDTITETNPLDHDLNGTSGGSMPTPETDDPSEMTVRMATDWLDDHKVDHAGITLRDDLRELVRKTMAALGSGSDSATGAADTTIMVKGGASDVVE